MTHPLLTSLRNLADASDPAHLEKLKAEMEKTKADLQASYAAEASAKSEAALAHTAFASSSARAEAAIKTHHAVSVAFLKAKKVYQAALAASQ